MQKIKDFFSDKKRTILFMAIFPIVFFYYEILLRLFTGDSFFDTSIICTILFSFAYGMILYILLTVWKNAKLINILTSISIGAFAIIYLVEYFVYRQFKVFYDINTVVGGAGDALTTYTKEAFALIFSPDGILKIVLYLLPLVLYLIFSKHLIAGMLSNLKIRIISIITAIVCYGISIAIILTSSVMMPLFTSQYNFQESMQKFGLITTFGI